jgi:hypothetical protein
VTKAEPIVERASKLQADADALLASSGLVALLKEFGHVTFQGSYLYRLMTVPDIDICVTSPQAGREQARAILLRLIDQRFWNAFFFGDWVQFHHEGFPTGFYIGLKHTFRDKRWKIDIWNLPEVPPDSEAFERAMSSLSHEQRRIILEIKEWRDSAAPKVPSKAIYDAVLHGKACDVSAFQKMMGVGQSGG